MESEQDAEERSYQEELLPSDQKPEAKLDKEKNKPCFEESEENTMDGNENTQAQPSSSHEMMPGDPENNPKLGVNESEDNTKRDENTIAPQLRSEKTGSQPEEGYDKPKMPKQGQEHEERFGNRETDGASTSSFHPREADLEAYYMGYASGGPSKISALAALFRRKSSVLDGLCLRLDIDYKIIQNWRHLADLLGAPDDVKDSCKCGTKHSPTELLFDVPSVSSVTIAQLLVKLNEIHRNDVFIKITNEISKADRKKKISETLIRNHELCDEVALLLDKDSCGRLNNNWRRLGQKLDIARDDLDQIGRGNNPAKELFLYAYITLEQRKLKAGYFRLLINNSLTSRNDVKGFLDALGVTLKDERSLEDVFPPESDNLRKLCGYLNRNAGGTVQDWKNLASAWDLRYETYKSFDNTEKPKPTKILLEDWLVQARPGFTVQELCGHLATIKRNDAREYLEKEAT